MILTVTCLQKDLFLTGEENCMICWIVGVEVLSCLRWGMFCVLLGVYHTLMWNRIFQHGRRGLLHILLWCLLRGRLGRRMGKTTIVFQPFEISDLGAMMSVMDELTTKGTREYGFNIISPLAFIIISPLGVDSCLDLGCCYSCSILYSWHCSMDGLDWMYSTVQKFGIDEQHRVEQNSPSHGDVGKPWVVEDQEMGSMDSVVVPIRKVHRKA
jgi:hypothetical protein